MGEKGKVKVSSFFLRRIVCAVLMGLEMGDSIPFIHSIIHSIPVYRYSDAHMHTWSAFQTEKQQSR